MKTREYTNRLYDMMDSGAIDPRVVAEMCLQYMSERDVADMFRNNDLEDDELEDADDSMDGDTASALASAGWGTDEDYGTFSEEY